MNVMKQIRVEKLTLNIGVGQAGDKLEKATKLLGLISGSKPVQTRTMKRIPTWGLRPKLNIGCKVTLRGEKAKELLVRLLSAKDKLISLNSFDKFGNLSFGIAEYIDIPGVNYDPDIGIIGLECAVTVERPGFRIKRRRIKSKVSKRNFITREESAEYFKSNFKIKIKEEEEE